MTDAVKPGDGSVTITLYGKPHTLKPTFAAAQTLSRQTGGIVGAIERVAKVDIDVISQVVRLGLGYGPTRRGPKDLEEEIWRNGLDDTSGGIVNACITYLRMLNNGGRPVQDTPDDEDEQEGQRPN